jgi:hypothetical protein
MPAYDSFVLVALFAFAAPVLGVCRRPLSPAGAP